MTKIKYYFLAFLFFNFNFFTAQSNPAKIERQIGNNKITGLNSVYNNSPFKTDIINGKKNYSVNRSNFSGVRVEGDIKFPKKGPAHERIKFIGGFEPKSNVNNTTIGLRADFIQLIPEIGLVGIKIPNSSNNKKPKEGDLIIGNVFWQLDLNTGEVKAIEEDQIIMINPKYYIFSDRLIHLSQISHEGVVKNNKRSFGYYYEDSALKTKWDNLAPMSVHRGFNANPNEYDKSYYRRLNNNIQIAEQREGESFEINIFDNQLQLVNNYYPALLLYRNYEKMPSVGIGASGKELIANYRSGKGKSPDWLFHRIILVPSQEIEGLYGILEPDGKVNIPEGSLGLSPIFTEEKNAEQPSETYLLTHFFVVAYPADNHGNIKYAIANPEGKLSFGSEEKPVWKNFEIYHSQTIAENNKHTFVHPELVVAELNDGNWQTYLASRYQNNAFRYESLNYFFPSPIGNSAKTPLEAVASAEEALVRMDDLTGKYKEKAMAEYKERLKRDWEKQQAQMAIKRKEEAEKYRNTPAPTRTESTLFKSDWKGFSYTPETTRRYNQTVNQSNYNNSMKSYNNYLNNRIYRKY